MGAHRKGPRVRRWRPAVAVAAIVVSVGAGGALVVLPSHRAAGAATSNTWMGSSSDGSSTTLAAIRSIIGADTGPAASLTGAGVGIALIDTGVAPVPGIPAEQIVNGPDLSFESQSDNTRYLDAYGHGTHLAGIIVGSDPQTGTGIAPKAKVTSIKVGTSSGAVDVTQVIAAVDWVVAHRNDDPANPIRIINLSYGTGGNPHFWTDPLAFAVEQAWKAGIVVVVAAGNEGGTQTLSDPANDGWVIAVGSAVTKGTTTVADDEISTFTNQPASGHRADVLAPGEGIVSLRDPGSDIDLGYPSARIGNTLFRGSGTSQAAAIVSAALALVLQARPTMKPNAVKGLLLNYGEVLTAGNAAGKGYKMVNVNDALIGATPWWDFWQSLDYSTGTGTLEATRGNFHVLSGNVPLTGEASVWGSLRTTDWTRLSANATSWAGGSWMGYRVAGDGWTGSSWASATWAGAPWPAKPWDGAPTWTDPTWVSHYWAEHAWAGGDWVSHYWADDTWATASWG